jgi:hypothetical protein
MAYSATETRGRFEAVESGSTIEAISGFAAIVLTLVGLGSILPGPMAAIAVIVVGAALLLEGAAVAARYFRLTSETEDQAHSQGEVSGGISAEFLGGATGIVLGLLALIGVYADVLIPVAAIVFGGSLLIGSTTSARLNRLVTQVPRTEETPWMARVAQETMNAAAGAEFMIGVGSGVLGVLAVIGVGSWLVLSLVALLAVGVAVLLTGTAVSGRMLALLQRR